MIVVVQDLKRYVIIEGFYLIGIFVRWWFELSVLKSWRQVMEGMASCLNVSLSEFLLPVGHFSLLEILLEYMHQSVDELSPDFFDLIPYKLLLYMNEFT